MSQTGSASRRKKARPNPTDADRISNLPEGILSNILSRLPIEDAVATSILSKDWEYKWTSIYNIQFKDAELYSYGKIRKTSFISFVDRVLLLSKSVTIKKFSFSAREKYDLNRIVTWISAALMRNVESVEITYRHERIILPRCLFYCSSLRRLVLNSSCILRIPAKTRFYNLKVLSLSEVHIQNEVSSADKLKVSFPVLYQFKIINCKWSNLKSVEIRTPALKIFNNIHNRHEVLDDCVIKICGAKLEKFESHGGLPEVFILGGSSVAFADLQSWCHSDDELLLFGIRIRKLLKGFSGLKHVKLSEDVAKALALSRTSGPPLRMYDKLEKIEILRSIDTQTLMELLHVAPSLKFLSVPMTDVDDYDFEEEESETCSSLSETTEIHFQNFHGTAPQFELAKFILKNAVGLERLFLDGCSGHGSMSKTKIVEKLLSFPKASTCLTIAVL